MRTPDTDVAVSPAYAVDPEHRSRVVPNGTVLAILFSMSTTCMSPRDWFSTLGFLTAAYPVTPYMREDSLTPAWRLKPGATQAGVLGALQVLAVRGAEGGVNAPGFAAAADRVRALVALVPPVTTRRLTDYALKQLRAADLAESASDQTRLYAQGGHLDRADPAVVAWLVAAELCLVHNLRMTRALRVMTLLAVDTAVRRVRGAESTESSVG